MKMSSARRVRLQGSVLVLSYFTIVVLLGVAIPQTMRSLSSVRLESRAAGEVSLRQIAEAGLDEAIQVLHTRAFFGFPGATGAAEDAANTNYQAGGMGVGTCTPPPPGWTLQWDCLPSTTVLPGYPSGNAYTLYVQDVTPSEGGIGRSGQWVRKRIRIITRYPTSAPGASDFVLEAIVVVTRKWEETGLRVGSHLIVSAGNGIEDNIVHGEAIYVYGPVTGNAAGDSPIHVGGDQAIWGKVYVNPSPPSPICCDTILNPPAAVGLTNSGAGLNARIRRFDDFNQLNGEPTLFWPDTDITGDGTYRAMSPNPSSPNYHSDTANWGPIVARDANDGTAPEDFGYLTSGMATVTHPQWAQIAGDLPEFIPGNPAFRFDPVTMQASDPGCATREIEPPGSGRITTFCRVGDNNGDCLGSDTDFNPVHHIGLTTTAGGETTVEYCVKFINAGEGSYVRFQGDNIRVYASGYYGATPERAFRFGANSHVYSFKTDVLNASDAFGDPTETKAGKLSFQVLESNKVLDGDGNPTLDQSGNEIAPQVDVSADHFFGTVYAPRSEVNFSSIHVDDRSAGPVVARVMTTNGNQGRGYMRIRRQPMSERNRVVDVRVIAWRRCRNAACTQ